MTKWTKSQQQAIDMTGHDILVSAAAGSGKTAVLVERIIKRIQSSTDPVDVDELLVMTFTKAAAAQMRSRIKSGIEKSIGKMAEGTPEYTRLKKQSSYIDSAKIMTVHSFCLSVIHEHADSFGEELDPSFRIADDAELNMLKADVMEDMLEKCYAQSDEDFMKFVDAYAFGKTDQGIRDFIFSLFTFSRSTPWPEKWLEKQYLDALEEEFIDEEKLEGLDWIRAIEENVKQSAEDIILLIDRLVCVCAEDDGPSGYTDAIQSDRDFFACIIKCKSYREMLGFVRESEGFSRLGRNPKTSDADKTAFVKKRRDGYKTFFLKKIRDRFFGFTMDQILSDIKETKGTVKQLIRLTQMFTKAYAEKKRDRNIVDFDDLEHFTLKILYDRTEGKKPQPSLIAKEYSESLKEIYVDEYQDSNDVQEEIIKAIDPGEIFLVGDVKQSIYAFRQARPQLFTKKYESFVPYEESEKAEKSGGVRIDLAKNFRSRIDVINAVNDVFLKLMSPQLGGIRYDEAAALYQGATFPENQKEDHNTDYKTELLLCDPGAGSESEDDEDTDNTKETENDLNAQELEARLIAGRIKELTDSKTGLDILDTETGEYRKAIYSDIAILLRAQEGRAQTFADVLRDEGIPAYAQTGRGYFDALEVRTVLSILAVIDNPLQDIPLAAYLRSPMAGITDRELAVLMSAWESLDSTNKKHTAGRLYSICTHVSQLGQEMKLQNDIERAIGFLERCRKASQYLSLTDLIRMVYDQTGYYDYVCAMPYGQMRSANLDMLIYRAGAFEETGYRGLFQFIRYIDSLRQYDTDFGEANISSENDNTVKIMSIHKSKGLEFPICFISAVHKHFNTADTGKRILTDSEFGIGCDMLDPENHTKSSTLKKNLIAYRLKKENLGEELRILYVAMTRAREKLILTGVVNRAYEKPADKEDFAESVPPSATLLMNESSFFGWISLAMEAGAESIRRTVTGPRLLSVAEAENVSLSENLKNNLKKIEQSDIPEDFEDFKRDVEFKYPYIAEADIKGKYTVSELKMHALTDADVSESEHLFETDANARIKKTRDKQESLTGAGLGTLYHRILEHIDYSALMPNAVPDKKNIGKYLKDIGSLLHLSDMEKNSIRESDFMTWFDSEIAERCAKAAERGELFREKQFIMQTEACAAHIAESKEQVLVQGIIDAYFIEDGKIVLIDYKTDRVFSGDILKQRYSAQLDYYASALSGALKIPVGEKIIWSFCMSNSVYC